MYYKVFRGKIIMYNIQPNLICITRIFMVEITLEKCRVIKETYN